MTFERFMEQALHDPHQGYYAGRIAAIGRRGDFTTAPMISEALARAISAWAVSALRETGCRDLIEIGPGEGLLSHAVPRHMPWLVRRKVRLHLVETSPVLAERQQALLGKSARWHRNPADALAACQGRAVIFSNELVDAFPVRRYQFTESGWRELELIPGPGGLPVENLLPPGPLPESSSFSEPHPAGQWIEVHESYRRWLAAWLPAWKAGRMLTIDYGAEAGRLYHRRRNGTMRGYLMQQRLEGPAIYQNPGRQDLTADVNFTDLVNWSGEFTSSSELRTLAGFVREHIDPGNPGDRMLTAPGGAGEAFLVLDQKR